jgi:hypothetical protein
MALPPFCDRDPVPARYRVLPGVDVCIWCNNGLAMDTPSRMMWCREHDGNGHCQPVRLPSGEASLRSVQLIAVCPMVPFYLCFHMFVV